MTSIISKEICQYNNSVWFYANPLDSNSIVRVQEKNDQSIFQKIKHLIKSIILPDGYPDSVSVDYLEYQIWDTLQAFCSTITGTLAMKAVFAGIGVGDSNSTPLAAVFTWLTKDGISMIGKIGFASWKGSDLDFNCKKWRLFADILNDLALLTDLCIPYFNNRTMVTIILCLTTTMKGIVGVAGGATRASLTQHQAIKGNCADVSAKDSSQETCVNLTATLISLIVLSMVTSNIVVWFLFLIFTCMHIFCNYSAVRALQMTSLNEERLLILFKQYLSKGNVLNQGIVNREESVIIGSGLSAEQICGFKIKVGESMKYHFKTIDDVETIKLYEEENFLIIHYQNVIQIAFNQKIRNEDIIRSYYHAIYLACFHNVYNEEQSEYLNNNTREDISEILRKINFSTFKTEKEIYFQIQKVAKFFAEKDCDVFIKLLNQKGWNTDINHLYKGQWKLIWGKQLLEDK